MWRSILKTTLLAGTLDITAACIHAYMAAGVMPERVLRFVASGVFGKSAFEAGNEMLAWGLLFHFVIAFSCTATFFLLYLKLKFLSKNWMMNAVLIGIVAWFVTTQIIIPISNVSAAPFNILKASIAAGILIICIGSPIAYNAKRYFSNR